MERVKYSLEESTICLQSGRMHHTFFACPQLFGKCQHLQTITVTRTLHTTTSNK